MKYRVEVRSSEGGEWVSALIYGRGNNLFDDLMSASNAIAGNVEHDKRNGFLFEYRVVELPDGDPIFPPPWEEEEPTWEEEEPLPPGETPW